MSDFDLAAGEGRRTAHEYVRDWLRQAILRGTLGGGMRLVQSNLADELGVSTTPVREALRDLAGEGLIQLDAHRSAVVKQLTPAELREVQDLRRIIEPEAMRRAVLACRPESLERATALVETMEAEREDVGRWADLNRRFHAALVEDLRGTRMIGILRGLRDAAAPYVGLALQADDNQLEQANREHRELLQAFRARDGERAAALSVRHVALTAQVLERSRPPWPGDAEADAVPDASQTNSRRRAP